MTKPKDFSEYAEGKTFDQILHEGRRESADRILGEPGLKKLLLTGEIWQEGNMYTSYCPELDVASCGHTVAEARKNLLEALDIFVEETSKMGTLHELLEEG